MLWTPLHVYILMPQFFICAVLALVLSRKLKNKDYETRLLPLKICTVLLLIIEAAKQIAGIVTGYSTYWILKCSLCQGQF